jgi:hypothetical protein
MAIKYCRRNTYFIFGEPISVVETYRCCSLVRVTTSVFVRTTVTRPSLNVYNYIIYCSIPDNFERFTMHVTMMIVSWVNFKWQNSCITVFTYLIVIFSNSRDVTNCARPDTRTRRPLTKQFIIQVALKFLLFNQTQKFFPQNCSTVSILLTSWKSILELQAL